MVDRDISVAKLREIYVRFFESKGHHRFPSGSLIPYDVTGKLDESLLFNGAGMIQFKPYFLGSATATHPRLVTVQKCLRTGDIDETGDDSHLTFFEMLGNFSFGNYFKKEAIAFSWEFLTDPQWLGLDPHRLAFTVFEEDDEAEAAWSSLIQTKGISATGRVFRLGEESNYWPANSYSNGPPGPCGPNSEMFYWVAGAEEIPDPSTYRAADFIRDEKAGKWLEIWNDVFISFDWQGQLKDSSKPALGYQKTAMPDLPFKSIDTGMGLERTTAVLSGKRSVFETDAFEQILARIQSLSTIEVGLRTPEVIRAERIIADHCRAMTVAIADGILPANNGRGYVLRRLIRRAVLQGFRTLKMKEGFLAKVCEAAMGAVPAGASPNEGSYSYTEAGRTLSFSSLSTLGEAYPEVKESQATILQVLSNEEHLFRRTLEHGMARLESLLQGKPDTLSGEEAFRLYDTFGFPLEITLELAEEAGWGVDIDGFEETMKETQERSRAGQERDTVYGNVGSSHTSPTEFLGYQQSKADGVVIAVEPTENGARVILDSTPFYAASGGQIGDRGVLIRLDGADAGPIVVNSTSKSGGVFFHHVGPNSGLKAGDRVGAEIDVPNRAKIQRNHTATHLLHAALHKVVGPHASQAGSYVGPDRLRFDFTHGAAVTPDQLQAIEAIVQQKILGNSDVVTHVDLPIAEAKRRGAMALFGEKYGDKVRMVEVGEFSRELCGGTHVRTTGEIGLFHIVSEGSASSGIRRIEAITGEAAVEWADQTEKSLRSVATLLKTNPQEVGSALEKLLAHQKELKKQMESLRASPGQAQVSSESIGSITLRIDEAENGAVDEAKGAVDRLVDSNPHAVGISSAVMGSKIIFAVKVGQEAQKAGIHAGELVAALAKVVGGGGGGNPGFATAGGKDAGQKSAALDAGRQWIASKLGLG